MISPWKLSRRKGGGEGVYVYTVTCCEQGESGGVNAIPAEWQCHHNKTHPPAGPVPQGEGLQDFISPPGGGLLLLLLLLARRRPHKQSLCGCTQRCHPSMAEPSLSCLMLLSLTSPPRHVCCVTSHNALFDAPCIKAFAFCHRVMLAYRYFSRVSVCGERLRLGNLKELPLVLQEHRAEPRSVFLFLHLAYCYLSVQEAGGTFLQ